MQINQKWRLEKDVLPVHALFLELLKVLERFNPCITFITENTKTLTANFSSLIV